MRERLFLAASGAVLLVALSGCPVTDNYFVDNGATGSGDAAGVGAETSGGTAPAPPPGGEQGGSGGMEPGPGPVDQAGAPMMSAAGMPPAPPGCMAETERCNGHDDNCNTLVDENACNSRDKGTMGCVGFVLASRPDHGYMLCTTGPKDYAEAQLACQQQDMRLAWLETEVENAEVSALVTGLTSVETTFGANDRDVEGEWVWDGAGGTQFWEGDETGSTVDGAFAGWAPGTPNDDNGGEDCAVLMPMTGAWGDRACSIRYAYLCEEPEP